jgi:hypothetical protein
MKKGKSVVTATEMIARDREIGNSQPIIETIPIIFLSYTSHPCIDKHITPKKKKKMENDADDVKPSFRGALDHLAYAPPNGAPLTSGSSASTSTSTSSPTLSPRHHPRRTRATTSAPDKAPKRARSPDVQKSDVQHHSRDGGQARRRHSKFFVQVQVQVPAAPPSFNNNNNNKKRKRDRGGGEKEVRIRPRKGRAQKRQKMSGPEAPAPGSDVADVDADGRASPVTVVERFLPDYVAMNLDGTLRPFLEVQEALYFLFHLLTHFSV